MTIPAPTTTPASPVPPSGEFDDLLGIRPAALANPIPVGTPRAPVVIDHATQAPVSAAARVSPLPPAQKVVTATAARLRLEINRILVGMAPEIEGWIRKVAEVSPKAALDIIIELSQFSTPKLKAIAMEVNDNSQGTNARKLSMEELQRMVAGGVPE